MHDGLFLVVLPFYGTYLDIWCFFSISFIQCIFSKGRLFQMISTEAFMTLCENVTKIT